MLISLFDDNYNEMIKSLYFVFFFIFICDDKNIVVLKLIVVKKKCGKSSIYSKLLNIKIFWLENFIKLKFLDNIVVV